MPRPVTANASATDCQLRPLNYFLTPIVPAACVFKQCNIANFDLNYDLSDSEIKEAKEEDTSTDLFD